ncbi:MAG: protein kinase [Pseudomonadota bacterium]|nr:protein kinase [Pseudomonadota bacterium]
MNKERVTDISKTMAQTIPGFELVKEIGIGSVTKVYLAVQREIAREAAVKMLLPQFGRDARFSDDILQEARVAARLNHRSIAPIYTAGYTDGDADASFYITMEYLPGGNLRSRIGQGMALQQATRILVELALALDYAHSKAVIHGCVKPENILFREDDSVLLSDFGMARVINESFSESASSGVLDYYAPYLSLEQALARAPDARSDLYSLGLVFYEMLTGEPLRPANSTVFSVIKSAYGSLPAASLPERFGHLQALFEKMVARNPDDRFQSGQALADAVQQATVAEHATAEPTTAEPATADSTTAEPRVARVTEPAAVAAVAPLAAEMPVARADANAKPRPPAVAGPDSEGDSVADDDTVLMPARAPQAEGMSAPQQGGGRIQAAVMRKQAAQSQAASQAPAHSKAGPGKTASAEAAATAVKTQAKKAGNKPAAGGGAQGGSIRVPLGKVSPRSLTLPAAHPPGRQSSNSYHYPDAARDDQLTMKAKVVLAGCAASVVLLLFFLGMDGSGRVPEPLAEASSPLRAADDQQANRNLPNLPEQTPLIPREALAPQAALTSMEPVTDPVPAPMTEVVAAVDVEPDLTLAGNEAAPAATTDTPERIETTLQAQAQAQAQAHAQAHAQPQATEPTDADAMALAPALEADTTEPSPAAEIEALMADANHAMYNNHLMQPMENSAYQLYMNVLERDPDHAAAKAGLGRIVDRYLAIASQHLNEGELDQAETYAARAQLVAARDKVDYEYELKVEDKLVVIRRLKNLEVSERLERWLARLKRKEKLSVVDMDNAYAAYMAVLELNMADEQVKAAQELYANAYYEMGSHYLDDENLETARELIARGLQIKPKDEDLRALEARWVRWHDAQPYQQ